MNRAVRPWQGGAVKGYRMIDHTADLALEVWAGDEPALLGQAASALIAILTEDAGPGEGERATRAAEIEGLDAEDRLVQWLNEVLYLAVVQGFLYEDAELSLAEGGGLRASIRGRAGAQDRIATELKSVTYHDLLLSIEPDRARARIVIDV